MERKRLGRRPSFADYVRRHGRRARDSVNRGMVAAARRSRLGHYVVLDYPPTNRLGLGPRRTGRLHDVIAGGEARFLSALRTIADYEEDLARIPPHAENSRVPGWVNGFLPGLDAGAIYAFLRSRDPRTYLEIGSGTSTRFARRAIEDAGLRTRIVSIDPSPRNEIDDLCDEVVRQPLELADRTHFAQLRAGDVIFLDGSHRVFTGSDATVFFVDLLPELPAGVLVGVHDVYLPDDYPEEIADRHYSEQYLLAAYVLAEPAWLRPVLPAAYVSGRPELAGQLDSLWGRPELRGIETHGVAFWFEIADSR